MDRKKKYGSLFLAASLLGAVYLAAEMIMKSMGRSICLTEGCRVVAEQARFGDISILLIGFAAFAVLSMLSFLSLRKNRPFLEKTINAILVASLAAEGFFTGYQAFGIHALCLFCLIAFGFILALSVLRLLYGEKEILAGFVSFAGIFALFYLVLPSTASVSMPQDEMVLFYSKDCKYCQEVMKEIEENKLTVKHIPVTEYSGVLKNLGIEHVPTLMVNDRNRKILLTGKEAIDGYLFCGTDKKEQAVKSHAVQKKAFPVKKASTSENNLLLNTGKPAGLFSPPSDEGMCKEDAKCD